MQLNIDKSKTVSTQNMPENMRAETELPDTIIDLINY